jgi:hypothetical protein
VVRQPIAVTDRSRRRLEQHLVHFPRASTLFSRAIWRLYSRLPSRSRLRQGIARRYVRQGLRPSTGEISTRPSSPATPTSSGSWIKSWLRLASNRCIGASRPVSRLHLHYLRWDGGAGTGLSRSG